ncbi:MAG: hypothetical protein NTW87_17600 [Planctomycetota bacterium]|nr:hypothetical protein [Planctomycetota bacterium]
MERRRKIRSAGPSRRSVDPDQGVEKNSKLDRRPLRGAAQDAASFLKSLTAQGWSFLRKQFPDARASSNCHDDGSSISSDGFAGSTVTSITLPLGPAHVNGFSWQETIRHVGRVVVMPCVTGEPMACDLDEFSVRTSFE